MDTDRFTTLQEPAQSPADPKGPATTGANPEPAGRPALRMFDGANAPACEGDNCTIEPASFDAERKEGA